MKLLIVAIALFAAPLFASPFLLSDPLPPEVTHCGVRVNSDPVIDVPVTLSDADRVCLVDLLNFPIAGAYDVTLTSVIAGSPRFETVESPVVRLREVAQSGRVRWQAWTNLFCPNTGAACYWQ